MTTTALSRFKRVCHKHLVMKDDLYIDVIFGTVFANRVDSKPVWLYLVGPPSSGKTEILQALNGEEIFQVSTLSKASLISGYKDKETKNRDESLLPKLNGKTMVIKDFTAMVKERQEILLSVIGRLRDAYDGYSCRAFGTGIKGYHSKFGLIAAVTNIIDKHRGVLAELGERFLTYRCPEVSAEESRQRCWKVSGTKSTEDKEAELKRSASNVLALNTRNIVISEAFRKRLIDIAQYVAVARCEIARDPFTKEPEIPMPEIATRLTRQLCDLAVGIAIAREEHHVSKDIEALVQKTALDSLTLKRLLLLKELYRVFPEGMTSKQISRRLRYSETIIRQWCEDLNLLNLIDKEFPAENRLIWKIKYKSVLKRIWS